MVKLFFIDNSSEKDFFMPHSQKGGGGILFAPVGYSTSVGHSVGRSVDQAMYAQYLFTSLLESCHRYSECP